jgi:hypothetical protein
MSDYMRLPTDQAARRYGISEGAILEYFSSTQGSHSTVVVSTMDAAKRVSERVKHIRITDRREIAHGLPEVFNLGQITGLTMNGETNYWVTCV